MEGHMCLLLVISGFAVLGPWVSGSVVNVTVKPGDYITLRCDCTCPTGVYTVWYRNCSHPNQPTLVLKTTHKRVQRNSETKWMNPLPRFAFVKDVTSSCFNLRISNITENDGGSYFCGTESSEVVEGNTIEQQTLNTYGNVTTRILFKSSEPTNSNPQECRECWILLFSLCPALALLCILLLVFVLYSECRKEEMNTADIRVQMTQSKDEDVSYAALEIRQASERPRRKKTTDSDFCTYSAIKTS